MSTNPIESAFHALIDLLQKSKTDYLVIGGLAVLASGEPRMTQDIDLILFIKKADLLPFLKKASKTLKVNSKSALYGAKTRGAFSLACRNVPVDVILASTELERSALTRKISARLFGRKVNLPSPEDLILLKLIPGRTKDLADVEAIVSRKGPLLDRKYLRKWGEEISDMAEDTRVLRQLKNLKLV